MSYDAVTSETAARLTDGTWSGVTGDYKTDILPEIPPDGKLPLLPRGTAALGRPLCLYGRPAVPSLVAAFFFQGIHMHGFCTVPVCRQDPAVLQLPCEPGGSQGSHGGEPAC